MTGKELKSIICAIALDDEFWRSRFRMQRSWVEAENAPAKAVWNAFKDEVQEQLADQAPPVTQDG